MKQEVVSQIHKSFEKLCETYGFGMLNEINEDGYYMVEYGSVDFKVEIEKYYRELYASVYKTNKSEDGVNLSNLLEYMQHGSSDKPESNHFLKEKDLNVAYTKQINHITTVLFENYTIVNDFFRDDSYKLNMEAFRKYWQTKHPEFYKNQ